MDVCVISGEEVCYDLHVKYPSQRLSIQLRAAARGDWIMRTVTLPTDLSFDEFIDERTIEKWGPVGRNRSLGD